MKIGKTDVGFDLKVFGNGMVKIKKCDSLKTAILL